MADARLSILLSARDEASAALHHVGNELAAIEHKTGAGAGLEKVGEHLSGIGKTAVGFALGGLVGNLGGDVAEQFKEILTHTVDLGRATRRLQLDFGGTTESISGLLAVFGRFGIEDDQAEQTLARFSKGLRGDLSATDATASKTSSFSGTLAELGVTASDATGHLRPLDQLILEVADGFKEHAGDGQNAARAQQLFGKSGVELVGVLSLGREGIIELEAEARKLGLTLTQDNVNAIRAFSKEQKNMGEAVEGLKLQLGVGLMPVFAKLAAEGAKWAAGLNADGGKSIAQFAGGIAGAIKSFQAFDAAFQASPFNPANASKALPLAEKVTGRPGVGLLQDLKEHAQALTDFSDKSKKAGVNLGSLDFSAGIGTLRPNTESLLHQDRAAARTEAAAAAAKAKADAEQAGAQAEFTLAKQKQKIDESIAAGEREQAIVQHQIALKTRESLDLKRSEAEIQLQLLPLKAQQANIEQQLLIASDKRASLERDAAVTRAQMASNASADALEGADFEERRLKAKIKVDALTGKGVSPSDIGALTRLALSKPELELGALVGGRGATLAERERQRAQQQQDLATLPLREKQAEIEQSVASLNAQSAEVQRKIEEARLHGVVDTTDLQKKKEALDDALFAKNQQKADLEGKGIVLNITQHITSSGEVDYDKIIEQTYQGVLTGLSQAQRTVGLPAPAFQPGGRTGGGAGVTGPF